MARRLTDGEADRIAALCDHVDRELIGLRRDGLERSVALYLIAWLTGRTAEYELRDPRRADRPESIEEIVASARERWEAAKRVCERGLLQ